MDNYYYKRVANNLLDIGIAAGGATNAATLTNPNEFSNNLRIGMYLGAVFNTVNEYNTRHKLADDERRQAARKLLQDKITRQVPGYNIANRSVPAIITNKCVDVIHKLILILYRKFNVFIDFEDDERGFEEKTRNYKDAASSAKSPNFVIRIGRLPREPLKTDNNWIRISGVPLTNPNAEFINGVYKPTSSGYKHTEHNDVTLSNPGAGNWQIVIAVAGTAYQVATGAPTFDLDVPTLFQVKTTRFNDGTDDTTSPFNLTRTNVGATYLPETGQKMVDQIDAPTDLPPNYMFGVARYSTVGTIYKSIHHDYYYKYYNHLQKILLFDSEAIYDVDSVNRYTDGMFPFIRLYKRDDYNYEPARTSKNPADELIYKDVVTFLDFMGRELHA